MSIIDTTYFIGDIMIPNTDEQESYLNQIISISEDRILRDALGEDLKIAFESGLQVGSPDQKWLDLRDGKTYETTYKGESYTVRWNGLKNSLKKSLLSYWAYYDILKNSASQTTGVGQKISMTENASNHNPKHKMIYAYNEALKLYGYPTYGYIHPYCRIYDPYDNMYHLGSYPYCSDIYLSDYKIWVDSDLVADKTKPSLYNFITEMNKLDDTTYPNWVFTIKRNINYFGI